MNLSQRLTVLNTAKKLKFNLSKIEFTMQATLQDGTTVFMDTMEVGSPIMVMDPTGQYVPAPEGELTLEDGTVIVVDAMGMIAEVRPAAAPATPPAAPAAGTEGMSENGAPAKADPAAKSIIESIIKETRFSVDSTLEDEAYVEAFKTQLAALVLKAEEAETNANKFKAEVEKVEEQNKELFALVEKMNEKPDGEQTHKPVKSKFLIGHGENANDALARIQRLRKLTN